MNKKFKNIETILFIIVIVVGIIVWILGGYD